MAKKEEKKSVNLTKNNKTCGDINKLKALLESVDENRRGIAENVFKRLEFMINTLSELEKQIKKDGAVIRNVNGNGFETLSEHPAQKSYNTMIGRYNALMKTYIDLIPSETSIGDELERFLSGDA